MTVGAGLLRALLRHLPGLRRHLEGSSWPQGAQGNFQKAPEEVQRQLQEVLEKLQRHLQDAPEKAAAWIHPLDPQAMKLCRLLDHHGIPITAIPDIGALHVSGLKIEEKAIAHVRREQ